MAIIRSRICARWATALVTTAALAAICLRCSPLWTNFDPGSSNRRHQHRPPSDLVDHVSASNRRAFESDGEVSGEAPFAPSALEASFWAMRALSEECHASPRQSCWKSARFLLRFTGDTHVNTAPRFSGGCGHFAAAIISLGSNPILIPPRRTNDGLHRRDTIPPQATRASMAAVDRP